MNFVDILVALGYFLSQGATEGYTWSTPQRRLENKIIKTGKKGKGFLDYHSWRFPATFFAFYVLVRLLGLFHGLGLFLVGLFLYERILNQVRDGKWFKKNGWEYHIGKLSFKRYVWQDCVAAVLGVLLWVF